MKEYLNQIFYEGLGKSIYVPLENKISRINNDSVVKYLTKLCKVIYFILSIIIAIVLLYMKL